MTVGEKVILDDKHQKIIVQNQYDNNPYLDRVDKIRKAGVGVHGENKLVGSIPIHLLKQVCDKLGVRWDDHEAKKEVIKRMLLSGDFDKFRVWKGTF